MDIIQAHLTKNPCYQANVNKVDSRYTNFQENGPVGLMLHSVGCSQPSAQVFIDRWNSPNYNNACVHAFIDANSGIVYQTLPWMFRGWHCAGTGNNTHIGIEMCESKHIVYTTGAKFDILNLEKAKEDCKRTYNSAVELFAFLCNEFNFNPLDAIVSHKEGGQQGIASRHIDPEHYWSGLNMPYTMDGFREDVAAAMKGNTLPFNDVPKNKWYYEPILWAYNKGIVKGKTNNTFAPNVAPTRAEVVAMIYRAFNHE